MVALAAVVGCKKDPIEPDNTPTGGAENAKNVFSVSAENRVRLAEGNLQYKATTDTWRFAENPWDMVGDGNLEASENYGGWIDCFAWGASGHEGQMPYSSGTSNSAYYHDGDIAGTQYDWGLRNAIQCGGTTYEAGTWRTLTKDEWEYMLFRRSNTTIAGVENARFVMAAVADQGGVILFPDQMVMPDGVVVQYPESINIASTYTYNPYTYDEWQKLSEAGCVFLPAAGCKLVGMNQMVSVGHLGCYWASSYDVYDGTLGHTAAQLLFNPSSIEMGHSGIQYPRSVRLAKNL